MQKSNHAQVRKTLLRGIRNGAMRHGGFAELSHCFVTDCGEGTKQHAVAYARLKVTTKFDIFLGYSDPKNVCLITKTTNFQGDTSDISAKKTSPMPTEVALGYVSSSVLLF